MSDENEFAILVDEHVARQRLDTVVSTHLPDCSRSFAATLIRREHIRVNGEKKKAGYRVKHGDLIQGRIPPPVPLDFVPEAIPLEILYEDSYIIVVNKPPGLVVHPAPGHPSGTLVNGLLRHCPDLKGIGGMQRPGIVHRLDKDTSGVLAVAKSDNAHHHLSAQFKTRRVQKKYLALVYGSPQKNSGKIELPIGRHPTDRKKMSTITRKGRVAETYWQVFERFGGLTLFELDLKTGRTHQIRVHCAAIGHPIIGDPVYFKHRVRNELKKDRRLAPLIKPVSRQMLHARRLAFSHPANEKTMVFEAPLAGDMQNLIDQLRSLD